MNKYIITAIIMASVGCTSNQNIKNNDNETIREAAPAALVELTEPVAEEKTTIHCTGIVDILPQHTATVTVPVGGFVESLNVTMGQWVNKGEVLTTLKHPDYIDMQTEYLTARSEFEYLEKEYQRQSTLHDEQAISEKVYQRTKADYNTLKAQLAGLSAKLQILGINSRTLTANTIKGTISITAPISGYVDHINIDLGKMITPEGELFSIINTKQTIVRLNVFARHRDQLKIGQEVQYSMDGTNYYKSEIITIAKSVETKSNTIQVLAKPVEKINAARGTYIDANLEAVTSASGSLEI